MLSTQKLYALVQSEDYAGAIKMLDEDPRVLTRTGWMSMSCFGAWGMPMYAHVASFLDAGNEASGYSTKYRDAAGMRAVAEKVFEKAPSIFADFSERNFQSLKCNYAIRGGWVDILRECVVGGLDREQMKVLAKDVADLPKVVAQFLAESPLEDEQTGKANLESQFGKWDDDIEDELCCICLDAECDAIFSPCAHNTLCFACSRDLKKCPLCRADGYAKLQVPM